MQPPFLATIQEENESEISTMPSSFVTMDTYPTTSEEKQTDFKMENASAIGSEASKLLECNTSSYRCFRQVTMSASSIFRDPYYYFPESTDPGIEKAWEYEEPKPREESTGREIYIAKCKELNIVPIGRVIRNLDKKTIDLKFFCPSEKQMKAMCIALKINKHVEELILQDNWLPAESVKHLSVLLDENNKLRRLNLRECRIGPNVGPLNDALLMSHIKELDISYNSLGDEGINAIVDALRDSLYIKKLDLSHNEITEVGSLALEEILISNDTIDDLNLSWNSLFTEKALKRLSHGICTNRSINKLNLSWNGISAIEAVKPIETFLRRSKTLRIFDISNNELKGAAMEIVLRGAFNARSLEEIKIGNNLFLPHEAQVYGNMFLRLQMKRLRLIDMENMVVKKNFLQLKNEIHKQGKEITHGSVLTNYQIHGPHIPKVLFDRCRYMGMKPKKKKQRVDFGHFVLSLPSNVCSHDEFRDLLIKKKLHRLDVDLINSVQEHYTVKKIHKINTQKLVEDYMLLYPNTSLPPEKPKKPPKPKKEKKGKKGKGGGKTETKEETPVPVLEETPSKSKITSTPSSENMTKKLSTPITGVDEQPVQPEAVVAPDDNELQQKKSTSILRSSSKVTFDNDMSKIKSTPTIENESSKIEGDNSLPQRLSSSKVIFQLDDGEEKEKQS